MKQLFSIILLGITIPASAQNKTWSGTTGYIYPNQFKSGTNYQFRILSDGGILMGPEATPNGLNTIISAYRDVSDGDPDGLYEALLMKDGNDKSGYWEVIPGSLYSTFLLQGLGTNGLSGTIGGTVDLAFGSGSNLAITYSTNSVFRTISINSSEDSNLSGISQSNGTVLNLLRPESGATDIPYLFGTDKTHTADNLLSVQNNNTNKFSVSFDGKISTDAPSGGTAGAWKLGTASAGTITADKLIEVEIGGVVYQIPAKIKP